MTETHHSLTQWKFTFNNFYRKDPDFNPLLKSSLVWDASAANYSLTGMTAADQGDNLETLLGNLAGFLPFPYLTSRILKESTRWGDVWNILFSHYQVEPSQEANLDFISLTIDKANKESYQTFHERLCHHQWSHLAKHGTIVQGVTNATEDKLTFSHLNLITQFWMMKLSPDLPSRVSVEFAAELQAGTQIAHLVPRSAKRVNQLLQTKSTIQTVLLVQVDDAEDVVDREGNLEVHNLREVPRFKLVTVGHQLGPATPTALDASIWGPSLSS